MGIKVKIIEKSKPGHPEEGKTVELPLPGEVRLSFGNNAKKTNKRFKASDIIKKKRVSIKPDMEWIE